MVIEVLLLSLLLPAADPVDVAAALEAIRARHALPGMVCAAVREGAIVARGAAGLRRADGGAKVTLEDRFHIGSCTKAMTATLCAMLVERKRLSFEATIPALFPRAAAPDAWRGATLEQLLRNRGGAPENLDADGLWKRLWEHEGTPVEARALLLEGVLKRAPFAPPGTKFLYSNAGFAIAGHAAETAAGKPFEELMRTMLFEPLGMESAGFGAPGGDSPCGHRVDGTPVPPGPGADNPPAIAPAGRAHMSIGDWAKFAILHLERDRFLAKETFARLHEPVSDYAMGWAVTERSWAKGKVLTHAGSNTMWFCVAWLAPNLRFGALVACNIGGDAADTACDEAASMLVSRFAGR